MANGEERGDREELGQDPFVERMRPDPSEPPEQVRVLEGLLGDSDRGGYKRLYFTRELDYYAEFRQDDVVFAEPIPSDQPPFLGQQATRVGIRRSATVEYTRVRAHRPVDEFDLDVRLGPPGGPEFPPLATIRLTECIPCNFTVQRTECIPCFTEQGLTQCIPCDTQQELTRCVPCLTQQLTQCVPCFPATRQRTECVPCFPATRQRTECVPCSPFTRVTCPLDQCQPITTPTGCELRCFPDQTLSPTRCVPAACGIVAGTGNCPN
jgi:hypothetical protein